jgi:Leucine-rich repeat (LRR) protein
VNTAKTNRTEAIPHKMPLEEITRDLIREITHEYPKLESLNLSHNTIKEIKSLDLLPNLRKLDLSWNKIQYLPKDLGFQLQRLEYLNLSSNYMCDQFIRYLSQRKETNIFV